MTTAPAPRTGSGTPIRQIENLLDLMEFFAARGGAASLAQITAHFGWPRSSTFNLLGTLTGRGYLFEPEGRGQFYPTPRWLAMAQAVAAAEPIPEPLLRLARAVNLASGETVCIGAASGEGFVYLEVLLAEAPVRYAPRIGQRIPLHATAAGMGVLSLWPAVQRAKLLGRIDYPRYGSGTPMDAAAVEAEIVASLARGWFRSLSNYTPDLGGVALPVRVGARIYAVTVAGPRDRVEPQMPGIAALLQAEITRQFGPGFLALTLPGLALLPGVAG